MRKMERNEKKVISVANLPDDYTIKDPSAYIKHFRTTYLKRVRENQRLSIQHVAKECNIRDEELIRIESGAITEQDMMILNRIAGFYGIDYPGLLFLYKLAKRPEHGEILKMAAYHDQRIDEETEKELISFLSKFKDAIE